MGFLDKIAKELGKTSSDQIGQAQEELVNDVIFRRKNHERRWFDNNFFDDGYHFRVISKKTGRVIDHTRQSGQYVERAIPRASRQIRGVTNLMYAAEPYPVIYPERITIEDFRDPQTKQVNEQAYKEALEKTKSVARKQGNWLSTEWEEEQDLPIKLIDAIILAAKNSISWIQIYSETDKQKILTRVYDAFDVMIYGERRDAKDLPFMIKACETDLIDVLKDKRFKTDKLTPDNRYATSEIKEAYMIMRYGSKGEENKRGTVILKEGFMKEILTDDNWKEATKLGEENGAMEGKSKGDMVMRHPYSAGGVTLLDEYVDYDEYPLVPIRFEPGMLYQTPFIERFIPQNKSIDVIVTRLEKWVNAMVVGVYQKRKGENFQVSNFPGGQMVEYETTPLQQMQTGSVGNTPFNVVDLLNKYIDEQGATTSGGMNVPQGVKSGVAIESVKATEYANLKIPILMLKKSIKEISERMLERADKDYLEPQEVSYTEDGEPKYFDVIGQRGLELSQKVNKELPEDIIPISRKTKVRIEMEPGLGLTMQGKKEAMQQIIDYMIKLADPTMGLIPPEALKMVVKKFMESFGYGSTQEFMEELDRLDGQGQMQENTITQMKIAIIEALKDAGAVGPEMENRLVDAAKIGVLETLKESGMIDKQTPKETAKEPSESIAYKDLPPEGKSQMLARVGIQVTPEQIANDEALEKRGEMMIKQKELQLKEKSIDKTSYPINKFKKGTKNAS